MVAALYHYLFVQASHRVSAVWCWVPIGHHRDRLHDKILQQAVVIICNQRSGALAGFVTLFQTYCMCLSVCLAVFLLAEKIIIRKRQFVSNLFTDKA